MITGEDQASSGGHNSGTGDQVVDRCRSFMWYHLPYKKACSLLITNALVSGYSGSLYIRYAGRLLSETLESRWRAGWPGTGLGEVVAVNDRCIVLLAAFDNRYSVLLVSDSVGRTLSTR